MRMLFLGMAHPCDDARLYYREILEIKKAHPDAEISFLGRPPRGRSAERCEAITQILSPPEQIVRTRNAISRGVQRWVSRIRTVRWVIRMARHLQPHVTQASDIHEILLAIVVKLATRSRIIYDAHEDYYNQIFEYSGRTMQSAIAATFYAAVEFVFLRLFDAVYCTDEYLLQKYRRWVFGCHRVGLLRNFVNTDLISTRCLHRSKSKLNLVYIGSINPYRGVIECAQFVARFNEKYAPKCELTFSVYSAACPIVSGLAAQGLITHHGYLDHPDMLRVLASYDVGVCLWQHLTKFERNLPIKNFEYMAIGLPVITSDFGNLRKYVDHAQSGFCINPSSYAEFEQAVMLLYEAKLRTRLGENGQRFTESASFHTEAQHYVEFVSSCFHERGADQEPCLNKRCAS